MDEDILWEMRLLMKDKLYKSHNVAFINMGLIKGKLLCYLCGTIKKNQLNINIKKKGDDNHQINRNILT